MKIADLENVAARLRSGEPCVDEAADLIDDAIGEIERLRVERQWRKDASDDAERYRFLRSHPEWMGWEHDFRADEIDRQVDEQMAQTHNA